MVQPMEACRAGLCDNLWAVRSPTDAWRRHRYGAMLKIALDEIKHNYPGLSIKAEAKPYGEHGPNRDHLIKFYSKFGIEIIENAAAEKEEGEC